MSTFSPNLNLEEVARGGDVGTWDTPTNSNWTLMDSAVGAIATVSLNNANVVLSAAQFQSKNITFNSTLTGSVTITFPTSFTKSYEILHSCSGSSAFTITLETTAGGSVICAVPGQVVTIFNDGSNMRYVNFGGPVGTYFDWCGSSTPNWNDGCSIPPYINCNGGSFSSAAYPVLASMIGTTLPDTRGRTRYALDQGTARITGVIAGGNTLLTGAGDQNFQVHSHANTLNDPGHAHGSGAASNQNGNASGFPATGSNIWYDGSGNTQANFTGVTISNANAGSGGAGNMPPLLVSGLTLIRAG